MYWQAKSAWIQGERREAAGNQTARQPTFSYVIILKHKFELRMITQNLNRYSVLPLPVFRKIQRIYRKDFYSPDLTTGKSPNYCSSCRFPGIFDSLKCCVRNMTAEIAQICYGSASRNVFVIRSTCSVVQNAGNCR
jgi:hypothetical protein